MKSLRRNGHNIRGNEKFVLRNLLGHTEVHGQQRPGDRSPKFELAHRAIDHHALEGINQLLLVHLARLLKASGEVFGRRITIQGPDLGIAVVGLSKFFDKGLVFRGLRIVEKVVRRAVDPLRCIEPLRSKGGQFDGRVLDRKESSDSGRWPWPPSGKGPCSPPPVATMIKSGFAFRMAVM